jgi:hypothetical protein
MSPCLIVLETCHRTPKGRKKAHKLPHAKIYPAQS